ncbi:selenocysteine-specific translation elongation factor [Pseudactinotalea sp. HY160]|uniref:selenocysteine-specific translation elongation factor n=1 Tax=Pseudactinotalea sp. HY160 TaxID=2654490 RepID=UPI00128DC70C|nr:selenocysteine-specific translation elongation factor [Pseudactinotalea sp. HY160]MPV50464.1 selenocysteine-specific translation elongation factor [Pseudactinotalea sp. HY160]
MTSHVVATAGHVDHGKSALVRALTGMEPDRWEAERRRGLTIDLGFAWTTLVPGCDVSFVDVPGHERFLGNALAGLGPASAVCFVVAADAGWQPQSSDHRDVIAALGIERGIVVLSRADRADADRIAETERAARRELAGTGLAGAPLVVTSAVTGQGLDRLRTELLGLLGLLRPLEAARDGAGDAAGGRPGHGHGATPGAAAGLRLWLDRAFTITGAGTVVTGTLQAGAIGVGDRLRWHGHAGGHGNGHAEPVAVTVRGLQSRGEERERVTGVDRVAVNLRGNTAAGAARGDVLLGPGAWAPTDRLDVRRTWGPGLAGAGPGVRVHVGTAVVAARLRPLDDDYARLTLERALPLLPGDRLLLRSAHSRAVLAGVTALDLHPPLLTRRGDARRRAASLAAADPLAERLAAAGAIAVAELVAEGLVCGELGGGPDGGPESGPGGSGSENSGPRSGSGAARPPEGVLEIAGHWVSRAAWDGRLERLGALIAAARERDPLGPGPSRGEVFSALDLPASAERGLLDELIARAGFVQQAGRILDPEHAGDLGAAEAAVAEIEARLRFEPFNPPEAGDLAAAGLGPRELAAAERAGRLLRLASGVVLTPDGPARAMAVLARLPGPFTVSEARQELGTTRRVAVPLLEYLDTRGWTRRIDAATRIVNRS